MKDKVKSAYKASENIYDDVLTQDNLWTKLYIKLFWGGVSDLKIADELLKEIPNNFSGRLLDVPVGTGVFTIGKYKELPKSEIYGLDYSPDMLSKAWEKFEIAKVKNVCLIEGDVGKLEFKDESFNIVLSMNGLHAFPDKEKAYSEMFRVLKSGGRFISCFYIKGENSKTDFLVNNILAKRGWFTPPFETFAEVKSRLDKLCKDLMIKKYSSMILISGVKK